VRTRRKLSLISASAVLVVAPLVSVADSASAANGCGPSGSWVRQVVPQGWNGTVNWTPACNRHDDCYDRSSTTDRSVCDRRLGNEMSDACRRVYSSPYAVETKTACQSTSAIYYVAVRKGGAKWYHGRGRNN
jgi:hypothetical protein